MSNMPDVETGSSSDTVFADPTLLPPQKPLSPVPQIRDNGKSVPGRSARPSEVRSQQKLEQAFRKVSHIVSGLDNAPKIRGRADLLNAFVEQYKFVQLISCCNDKILIYYQSSPPRARNSQREGQESWKLIRAS